MRTEEEIRERLKLYAQNLATPMLKDVSGLSERRMQELEWVLSDSRPKLIEEQEDVDTFTFLAKLNELVRAVNELRAKESV